MPDADLHLHTYYSDGTFSPEELVCRARNAGLSTIAVTDHDTLEGCQPAIHVSREQGLECIIGTELTAEYESHEVHLLGYFVDPKNEELKRHLDTFQAVRQKRIYEMVERLNRLNVPLKPESVFQLAQCKSPGRPHVARALVKEGLCNNLDEAFERYLKQHRPAWVPKFKIHAVEAIELIHDAGGIAIMAHPGLNRNDALIPPLIRGGLDGLECYHSKHNKTAAEKYFSMTRFYGVLATGGSDCHGLSKGRPLLGTVRIPDSLVQALKDQWQRRRNDTSASAPPFPTSTLAS